MFSVGIDCSSRPDFSVKKPTKPLALPKPFRSYALENFLTTFHFRSASSDFTYLFQWSSTIHYNVRCIFHNFPKSSFSLDLQFFIRLLCHVTDSQSPNLHQSQSIAHLTPSPLWTAITACIF